MTIKGIKKYFAGFSILSITVIAALGTTFVLSASSNKPNNDNNLDVAPSEPSEPTPPVIEPEVPTTPPETEPEKPEEKPLILVPKNNITSSSLGLQNSSLDQVISLITKEWIVENKNLLFSSGQDELTVDKIEDLSSSIFFENNILNTSYIKIKINDIFLTINNFYLITSDTSLYELQGYPLGVGQAINISSYIKDKSKIMEAISTYIVNSQNDYVNNQKDFYMSNYIKDRQNLYKSVVNGDELIWNIDLRGKTKEFKNALSLIFFKKNWNNLFTNNQLASEYIANIKITSKVQNIDNNIDKYKIFATNIELIFEQEIQSANESNAKTVSTKTMNFTYNTNQQNSSAYEIIFSKNADLEIGNVIPINSSMLTNLSPKNQTIYLDSFVGLQNVINQSITKISESFTKDVLYNNKDQIFSDSYLLTKLEFIDGITNNGLVGTNYDKFSITVKWQNMSETTDVTLAISQDNRIKTLGLHNLWKTPISNKQLGIYTDSTNIFELRKRIPPFMWYEQINPMNNDKSSPYYQSGYESYTLNIRPRYIDATDDSIYASMNFDTNTGLADVHFKMYFRSIWKMTYTDFCSQFQKNIVPNLNTLNDIQIQWQLVKEGQQNGNRLEAKLCPTKIILIYRSGERVEWSFSRDFVLNNNIATPIHFIVDPSSGNKYKVVEL